MANDKLTINLNTIASRPQSSLTVGVKRPDFLTSKSAQFVAIARDASPSMSGQKADDATRACSELIDELALPANKGGFSVGIVDFDGSAHVANPTAPATNLVGSVAPIDTGRGSSTNIQDALRLTLQLVDDATRNADRGRIQLRPVALLFSDGQSNAGGDPRPIANDLKKAADLVTVAFGPDADEATLRELASSPQHFYRCRNGRELRVFLASVGQTLTATMSQGRNATVALTQIGHR